MSSRKNDHYGSILRKHTSTWGELFCCKRYCLSSTCEIHRADEGRAAGGRPHESQSSILHTVVPCTTEPSLHISNLLRTRVHEMPSMQMNRTSSTALIISVQQSHRFHDTTVHRLDDTIARREHHGTSYHTRTPYLLVISAKLRMRTTPSIHIVDLTTLYLNAMRKAGSSQYLLCRVLQQFEHHDLP